MLMLSSLLLMVETEEEVDEKEDMKSSCVSDMRNLSRVQSISALP
jgi:hypothetical protein